MGRAGDRLWPRFSGYEMVKPTAENTSAGIYQWRNLPTLAIDQAYELTVHAADYGAVTGVVLQANGVAMANGSRLLTSAAGVVSGDTSTNLGDTTIAGPVRIRAVIEGRGYGGVLHICHWEMYATGLSWRGTGTFNLGIGTSVTSILLQAGVLTPGQFYGHLRRIRSRGV
jgi:hypothetical protein